MNKDLNVNVGLTNLAYYDHQHATCNIKFVFSKFNYICTIVLANIVLFNFISETINKYNVLFN